MAQGKTTIKAESPIRKLDIKIRFNNKGRAAESAGVMATFVNDLHDVLRKHFCAHQIQVVDYKEPATPVKRKKK